MYFMQWELTADQQKGRVVKLKLELHSNGICKVVCHEKSELSYSLSMWLKEDFVPVTTRSRQMCSTPLDLEFTGRSLYTKVRQRVSGEQPNNERHYLGQGRQGQNMILVVKLCQWVTLAVKDRSRSVRSSETPKFWTASDCHGLLSHFVMAYIKSCVGTWRIDPKYGVQHQG